MSSVRSWAFASASDRFDQARGALPETVAPFLRTLAPSAYDFGARVPQSWES